MISGTIIVSGIIASVLSWLLIQFVFPKLGIFQ